MQNLIILFLAFLFSIGFPVVQTEEKNWPVELNTAKDAAYIDDLEKEVILELNKVRTNPKRYAEEYLEELLTAYKGKLYYYPGKIPVKTQEGVFPLEDCIRVLKKTVPQSMLFPAEGLSKAAAELADDQQKFGGIGHVSRKGLNPQKRIEKYGDWNICSSEDITYGSYDARQIVIALLIDDGVPDRGHRKNILNPCSRFVGVSARQHPTYSTICAIDYAGEYKTK